MTNFSILALMSLCISAGALAQTGAPERTTGQRAGDAVTQPVADIGLKKKDIPPLLVTIQDAPYSLAGLKKCADLRSAVAELDGVLGPDVDASPDDRERKVGPTAMRVTGSVINGFIPFRGVVREITGASAADRRYAAALYTGVARRSYLKGVMAQRGCKRG
jgi:hypothetical protein